MDEHKPVPVTFKDGSTWDLRLSPNRVALLTLHVIDHDFRNICNYVAKRLRLDAKTRREMDNLPNVNKRRVHQYRMINKAMTMELLTALLLTFLNKPKEVRSWCVQRQRGLPNNYSPPLHADISARYFNDENNKPYRLIVEVSAKKVVTQEFMRKQISQAWNHARVEAMNRDGGVVYALVINGGKVGSNPKIWEVYRDYVRENNIAPDDFVRLLPLYAADFVAIVRRIKRLTSAGGLQFGSGLLARAFDTLINAVSGDFMNPDPKKNWMCIKFAETVLAEAKEVRGDLLDRDRHEPAAKARRPARRRPPSKAHWRPYGERQKQARLKKQPLVLVELEDDQIKRAKHVNGTRKRITHALICGQYGRMFGTEKRCNQHYTTWSKWFSSLFATPLRTDSYEIDIYSSTFNLENRLLEARDG